MYQSGDPATHQTSANLLRYRYLLRIDRHSSRWLSAKVDQVYPHFSSLSNCLFLRELKGDVGHTTSDEDSSNSRKKWVSTAFTLQCSASVADESMCLMVDDSTAAAFTPYALRRAVAKRRVYSRPVNFVAPRTYDTIGDRKRAVAGGGGRPCRGKRTSQRDEGASSL